MKSSEYLDLAESNAYRARQAVPSEQGNVIRALMACYFTLRAIHQDMPTEWIGDKERRPPQ